MGQSLEHQTAQFPPGTMLDDKYRISRLLAVGGMGAVYVGEHTKLHKKVAIKVLRTELANQMEVVERFQREAIAASQIGHDNIVQVTDIGVTPGGVSFLVMEYLAGESLADRIKKAGPMAVPAACDICTEILSAVEAAHAAGIVHRDLKPENVFLAQRGGRGEVCKILDFGISRMKLSEGPDQRLTQTGLVMGTPYYMSPEQARGATDIGEGSDIYSTGVILYEMVCGTLPYEADNYNVLMFRVLSGEFVRPRQRRPELPDEIEQILLKAMALEPQQRFLSAAEFAGALVPFTKNARPSHSLPLPTRASGQGPVVGTANTVAGPALAATTAATAPVTMPRRRARWPLALAGIAAVAGATLAVALRASPASAPPASAPASDPPPASAAEPAKTEPEKTEPAAPAERTPAAPPAITIELILDPADAAVTLDGEAVDGSVLTRPRADGDHTLVVARKGYESETHTVRFDVNQRLQYQLSKRKSGRHRPARPGKPTRIISDSPYED